MKEKKLVKKWLNNELNHEELEAFKKLDAFTSYLKLSEYAQNFKAPTFDIDASLDDLKTASIQSNVPPSKPSKNKESYVKIALKIAAIFAISFGIYYAFFNNPYIVVQTQIAQNKSIILPDNSQVTLNSKSLLKYKAKNWDSNRKLQLEGEAFFKVAKGQTFQVNTSQGTVHVTGTQFNVKSRDALFEVYCFEGSVDVNHNNTVHNLTASNGYKNGQIISESTSLTQPSWLANTSTFKSVPFKQVLDEFERQYPIIFEYKNLNIHQLFTGSFSHNDMDNALQSITLPLQFKYKKQNGKVILLKSE